ncbi:MAG: type II toxin-antitoxin system RelE/ParE family toxin [Alphaproteobacteria bacterium]
MIVSFKNKGLREIFESGTTNRIDARLHERILRRLSAMDAAEHVENLNVPGYDLHPLRGFKPKRYTIHVNGPWCITFQFENGKATAVDFENYHER